MFRRRAADACRFRVDDDAGWVGADEGTNVDAQAPLPRQFAVHAAAEDNHERRGPFDAEAHAIRFVDRDVSEDEEAVASGKLRDRRNDLNQAASERADKRDELDQAATEAGVSAMSAHLGILTDCIDAFDRLTRLAATLPRADGHGP